MTEEQWATVCRRWGLILTMALCAVWVSAWFAYAEDSFSRSVVIPAGSFLIGVAVASWLNMQIAKRN